MVMTLAVPFQRTWGGICMRNDFDFCLVHGSWFVFLLRGGFGEQQVDVAHCCSVDRVKLSLSSHAEGKIGQNSETMNENSRVSTMHISPRNRCSF
eukprot:scaffold31046_cov157-Amphora_coffeaeformis.AAC.3